MKALSLTNPSSHPSSGNSGKSDKKDNPEDITGLYSNLKGIFAFGHDSRNKKIPIRSIIRNVSR